MNNRTKYDGEEYNVLDETRRFLAGLQFEDEQPEIDPHELEMRAILAAEEECLTQILPALMEASQFLSKKLPKAKRKRIQHELAHASEHLYGNIERLRHMLDRDIEE